MIAEETQRVRKDERGLLPENAGSTLLRRYETLRVRQSFLSSDPRSADILVCLIQRIALNVVGVMPTTRRKVRVRCA
jgi:hypothetical protein